MRRSIAELRRFALLTRFVRVTLCFLPLAGWSGCRATPLYTVVNLGSLGNSGAMVSGLTASGTAVGFVTNAQGNAVPVSLNGQTTTLSGIGEANGINSLGTIIGTSFANDGTTTVTEWLNGHASSLNISGYGMSINDAGEVAGSFQTSAGQSHAFTWSNGNLVDLGTLGGTGSAAYAINASGQVAGTSTTANGRFAAFFSGGDGLVNLGTLGGANSYGMDINTSSEVVGSAQTAQGYAHAFEWSNGQMLDLGTLGGSQSYAYGVNDAGAVVGYSFVAGNGSTDGFLYSNGVLVDLNSFLPIGSGWSINAAYAINNAGDILAIGTLDGQSYALDLVPPIATPEVLTSQPLATPEPAALLLTGVGLVLMGKLGRRRKPKSLTETL